MGRGQQSVEEAHSHSGEVFKRGRRRAAADLQLATPVQRSDDVYEDVLYFFRNASSFASDEIVVETAKELQQRLRDTGLALSAHRLSSARMWLESKIGFLHATLSNVIQHWHRDEIRSEFVTRLDYEAKQFETKLIWWQIELEREGKGEPPLDHGGF